MIEFSGDLRKYLGRGVAIRLCSGRIAKFRIKSFDVKLDNSGFRVRSLELDLPCYEGVSFKCRGLLPIIPEMVFRNRGECARYYFDKRLNELKSRLCNAIEKSLKSEKELDDALKEKSELEKKVSAMEDCRERLKFYSFNRKK